MVRHVLKDGRRVDDIAGRVVRVEECGPLYRLLEEINEKETKRFERCSDHDRSGRNVRNSRRVGLSDNKPFDGCA